MQETHGWRSAAGDEMEADGTADAPPSIKTLRSLRNPHFMVQVPSCSHFLSTAHQTAYQQESPVCGFSWNSRPSEFQHTHSPAHSVSSTLTLQHTHSPAHTLSGILTLQPPPLYIHLEHCLPPIPSPHPASLTSILTHLPGQMRNHLVPLPSSPCFLSFHPTNPDYGSLPTSLLLPHLPGYWRSV